MVISSRTPEGEQNRCPICGSDVCIEPSKPFGDATCPNCGNLLWFVALSSETRVFDGRQSSTVRNRMIKIISEQLGVPEHEVATDRSFIEDLAADSLDVVELVMEFEDEFA